jgi:hypothetical protein
MRYYAARIGNKWFNGTTFGEGFYHQCMYPTAGGLKMAINHKRHDNVVKDAFELALLAAGGEIVSFELSPESLETVSTFEVIPNTEPNSRGRYLYDIKIPRKGESK